MEHEEISCHANGISVHFQQIERQVQTWEEIAMGYEGEHKAKLHSSLALLRLHLNNYQNFIATHRRRSIQRRRRRHQQMRNLFMQMMAEIQTQFLENFPLCIEPKVFMKLLDESQKQTTCREGLVESSSLAKNKFDFFKDILSRFTEEQWINAFHMTKENFNSICSRLKTKIEIDQHEKMQTMEAFVAMCIYTLASGKTFRAVGLLYNKPAAYVRSALCEFVNALIDNFEQHYVSMPRDQDEIMRICKGFSKASHMPPCCLGVLCVFELPTFAYSEAGCRSNDVERVIVQTLIDNRLQFRKVEVAQREPLMFLRKTNELETIPVRNDQLPYFVVAPDNYPLRSWLMQKYDQPRQSYERDFNSALSYLNIFRELALKRLFGRWQILSSTEFIEPQSKGLIARACCILHNILEQLGEIYSEEWSESCDLNKYEFKLDSCQSVEQDDAQAAEENRNRIAQIVHTDNSNLNKSDTET
ncbi:uncharacterized protein LOC101898993 [Musca domestica]|uniref:Uncharacterized protein LOC101898993 n=1 Tax=Musca domestica TaxID=7370 RepID=A0A1I8MDM0_MUSDO|nr:uncharacterized protein LOC101898993 [Musca domestica]